MGLRRRDTCSEDGSVTVLGLLPRLGRADIVNVIEPVRFLVVGGTDRGRDRR